MHYQNIISKLIVDYISKLGYCLKVSIFFRKQISRFSSININKRHIKCPVFYEISFYLNSGADLGGGDSDSTPSPTPSVTRPPHQPKGPFGFILCISFKPTNPKIFLKAPAASVYTIILKGRAHQKNRIFWSKFSKKCTKRGFFELFFKNLPAAQFFGQNGLSWERSENKFGRTKTTNKT